MNARWQWQESGNSSGHMQRVADSGTYSRVTNAYRAFMGHSLHCDDCEYGEKRCETAKGLWATYIAARN
jgi:hypothetical protein